MEIPLTRVVMGRATILHLTELLLLVPWMKMMKKGMNVPKMARENLPIPMVLGKVKTGQLIL